MTNLPKVVGVLLAGGRSRRMGGEAKYLLPLHGRPLLDQVIERARPQVAKLLLNANGDPGRLSGFGLPVQGDVIEGQNAADCRWIASFATDTPFFPTDLVHRFLAAQEAEGADLVRAASGDKPHPVFGLWPVQLAKDLRQALTEEGVRKIDVWTARHHMTEVHYPTNPVDPFFNVNRPQDLEQLEALLRKAKKTTPA